MCNKSSEDEIIVPTTDLQNFTAENIVIEARDAAEYEACLYTIAVEDNKYRDDTDAYIELRLESLTNAYAYIYDGTGTTNATAFIENNQTAILGAPFRAPISQRLMLVAYTIPSGNAGSIQFSYQLHSAAEYPFFFEPFVG